MISRTLPLGDVADLLARGGVSFRIGVESWGFVGWGEGVERAYTMILFKP